MTATMSDAALLPESGARTNENNHHHGTRPAGLHEQPGGWPVLAPEALHGPAGDLVRVIEPAAEADPAAVLAQFLAAYAHVIGPEAAYKLGAKRMPLNLSVAVAGATARARKGTSWGEVKAVLRQLAPEWLAGCVVNGLSSGEGLIHEVRDFDEGNDELPEEERARLRDKRRLVVEPEFASALRAMGRQGNTLSAVLRSAWDGERLRVMTRNAPMSATGAHIGLIGHITVEELLADLGAVEWRNGFANRILFVCAKRARKLPWGGKVDQTAMASVVDELHEAVEYGQHSPAYDFADSPAAGMWEELYLGRFDTDAPGIIGALTARDATQTQRLATLYALLDRSEVILPEHVRAGLAVWDYAEQSARHVFDSATGDRLADRLLAALRDRAPEWVTRAELRDLDRHAAKARIDAALALLAEHGLAESRSVSTGGRPSEQWRAHGTEAT